MKQELIEIALQVAFEAGKWEGQVELEEHFEKEQFSKCMSESIISKKTAMPSTPPSDGRTVTVNLRSQKWRKGVRESSKNFLKNVMKKIEIFENEKNNPNF